MAASVPPRAIPATFKKFRLDISVIRGEFSRKREVHKGKQKRRDQARIALKRLEKIAFRLIDIDLESNETVDELIIKLAEQWSCFVATNDRSLIRKLVEAGVSIVYLRQRKRLEVLGKKM